MEENFTHIRYDREDLLSVLWDDGTVGPKRAAEILDAYEEKRRNGKDKPCQSKVFHGPGHQSSTFCEAVGGLHDETSDGKTLHMASLPSGGFAEWTDDDPYDRNMW